MKNQLMSIILDCKPKKTDQFNKGEVITRITQDIDTIINVVAEYFIPIITGILMFGVMIVVIFRYNFVLGIICLGASPIFFLFTRIFGKTLEKQVTIVSKCSEDFLNIVDESIDSKKVIRFFDCFQYEMQRFNDVLKNYIIAGKILLTKNMLAKKTFSGIGTLFPLIILVVGTVLIMRKQITLGILISILSCLNYILIPSTVLSNCLIGLKQYKVSVKRLECYFQNIDKAPDEVLIEDGKNKFGVSMQNVSFSFQDHTIFHNISFHIKDKEFVSIVGENGVGKSTLLNLLQGFLQPDSGRIFIGSIRITGDNDSYRSRHISPVLQNDFLFEDNVINNIYFSNEPKDRNKLVGRLVERNLFEKNAGKNGMNLSGGEKQKVVLARALHKKSEILLIDEGSTNFDLINLEATYTILGQLKGKKTILIIDHQMGFIKLSDRILYMENKDKIYLERHETLIKQNKNYQELYQKSVRG